MTIADQADRDRFARETARNFSVRAPAGVGKTTAIAQRVLHLARRDPAGLPRLAVVTYTRKAADEMRDRARRALVAERLPPAVLGQFNRAFFGTIHSFCLELLRRFGPLAGLPARLTLVADDAAAWLAFQRDTPDPAAFLPEAARHSWRQWGASEALWKLARTWPAVSTPPPPPGPCPPLDLGAVLGFSPKIKRGDTLASIRRAHDQLRRWQAAAHAGENALGLPACERGGAEFVELWHAALAPLRAWLAAAAAHAAAGLAAAFARAQLEQGRLGYDDFVRLAGRLLRDPALAERIRAAGYSVLLDEAQDTDPAQFAVLVGVAQPPGAPGLWTEGAGAPPAPGRFSMVGDPQQSIYDRSDVRAYRALHERLLAAGAGEELTFSVTMRCDTAVVAGVNEIFPRLLDGRAEQAQFVRLQARPEAGPGGIARLVVAPPADFPAKPKADEATRAEARALARFLAAVGPAGLGARDWSQVAVLAPRRDWLELLAAELRAPEFRTAGLRAQLHTGARPRGAEPARAWLGALLGVLADPADAFETTGVLREVFGISDDDLYYWARPGGASPGPGPAHPLAFLAAPLESAVGPVAAALRLLHRLQGAVAGRPLRDAVALAAEAVQLRERLEVLPGAPVAGGWAAALDALLDQAAVADARGETLADFAQALREGPAEAGEPVARPGELQLLTSYKAKGLEWPVVMLFGLFREPRVPAPDYPAWVPAESPARPPACLYDKAHAATGAARNLRAAARRAEYERLLYVAATRAKHLLVMMDAEALGADEDSLAGILGILPGGRARPWWLAQPAPGRETLQAGGPAPAATPAGALPAEPLPAWGEELFARARARVAQFARRVRPSSLARHTAAPERLEPDLFSPPDYPEEQPPPATAVNYGNWWHGVMETTPWAAGAGAWRQHWRGALSAAPDAERAQRELEQLQASLLARQLAAPGLEFATELPFLWLEPAGARAFDGCLDLAAWDGAAGRWLVVDWKTDRVEGAPRILGDRYAAQLAVYARMLGAVTRAPVEALIYSTRTGATLEIPVAPA